MSAEAGKFEWELDWIMNDPELKTFPVTLWPAALYRIYYHLCPYLPEGAYRRSLENLFRGSIIRITEMGQVADGKAMYGLKAINDTFGHDEGDFAIKKITSILLSAFRTTDIVARRGGDEFVVFTMGINKNYQKKMEEKLKRIIDKFNRKSSKPYRLSMSMGWSFRKADSDKSLDLMLKEADAMLYGKKKNKKHKPAD
ncbi:MAG: GGDEF domain-containing protein [Spirochaetales bacterium]|nr:GGDEF domain-containing protein [Spirochaetales bacterium]